MIEDSDKFGLIRPNGIDLSDKARPCASPICCLDGPVLTTAHRCSGNKCLLFKDLCLVVQDLLRSVLSCSGCPHGFIVGREPSRKWLVFGFRCLQGFADLQPLRYTETENIGIPQSKYNCQIVAEYPRGAAQLRVTGSLVKDTNTQLDMQISTLGARNGRSVDAISNFREVHNVP